LSELGTFMPELPDAFSNRWLTTIVFDSLDPMKVYEALQKNEIESRPLWKPMDMQPLFANACCYTKGVSAELFTRGLCLPSGTALAKKDVKTICSIVKSC